MSTFLFEDRQGDISLIENVEIHHDVESMEKHSKIRVLMVISQFHPIVGGAEKQAQLLGKTLIGKGIDVILVTGWWNVGTPRREIVDGIHVFRNFSCWGMFGIRGIRTLGGLAYMVSLALYLLVHRREYDLIHVHQALYPAFVSVVVGKGVLGKPVLVKTASSGLTSDIKQLRHFPFGGMQLRYLLDKMECLVAVSKVSAREFVEVGYPESRIVFIPNGVTVSGQGKKTYGNVEFVVTTVRLSSEKGIDVLLRAWALVMKEEKDLRLVIVGHGPLDSELWRLCGSLGLSGSVEFVGLTYDVQKHLEKADLFVLPSRTEGLSNALLEAMRYGLPCIATNVGGNIELMGEDDHKKIMPGEFMTARNGLLVNPDDVEGLSEAMLYFIGNGLERQKMGNRGRLYIQENYSIDLVADKYIALYQRMLDRKS